MCQQDVSRLLCPITPTLSARTGEYKMDTQCPLLKTLRISRWRQQSIKPRVVPHETDLREDHRETWQAHFCPCLPHHLLSFLHVCFFVYLFTICLPHWNVRTIDLVYLIQHCISSILAGRHSRHSLCRKKGTERRRERGQREKEGKRGEGGRVRSPSVVHPQPSNSHSSIFSYLISPCTSWDLRSILTGRDQRKPWKEITEYNEHSRAPATRSSSVPVL